VVGALIDDVVKVQGAKDPRFDPGLTGRIALRAAWMGQGLETGPRLESPHTEAMQWSSLRRFILASNAHRALWHLIGLRRILETGYIHCYTYMVYMAIETTCVRLTQSSRYAPLPRPPSWSSRIAFRGKHIHPSCCTLHHGDLGR
jgi:hypothetical protein